MEYICACAYMQSYVNIRCHLESFQALSTNFGDDPHITRDYCERESKHQQILKKFLLGGPRIRVVKTANL